MKGACDKRKCQAPEDRCDKDPPAPQSSPVLLSGEDREHHCRISGAHTWKAWHCPFRIKKNIGLRQLNHCHRLYYFLISVHLQPKGFISRSTSSVFHELHRLLRSAQQRRKLPCLQVPLPQDPRRRSVHSSEGALPFLQWQLPNKTHQA